MKCTYDVLQVYRNIKKNLEAQTSLCDDKAQSVSDVELLKQSKSEMIDYVNHALKNRLFLQDDLKAVKDACIYMRDALPEYKSTTDAINKFTNVLNNIKLDISPELSLDYLKKIKAEFDKFCGVYNKNGFLKPDYLDFIKVLNEYVWFGDYNFDAYTLYDELKVPVIGLYKNSENKMVVHGCIDEINKVLMRHIEDLEHTPKIADLDKQNKSNKLKQAVESVSDKKAKKESDDAWVDSVIKNVFGKE